MIVHLTIDRRSVGCHGLGAMKRRVQQLATVAWPAFLVAAVLEVAVFAFVDPLSLHSITGAVLQLSATAVYSLAFLVIYW